MRKSIIIIVALIGTVLIATGGVVAHENGESTHSDAPENGTASEWSTWMEEQMTEHMGAEAAEDMEERMGMTHEEMGEHMASEDDSMMAGKKGCH